MKIRGLVFFVVIVAGLSCVVRVYGQTWSKDQLAVIGTIEASWEAVLKKDPEWFSKNMLENALVWDTTNNPAPRGRESVKDWMRLYQKEYSGLKYELYPEGIVIEGNSALAHYYYSVAYKGKEEKIETKHGICTDVLVQIKNQWKYLGWGCADKR